MPVIRREPRHTGGPCRRSRLTQPALELPLPGVLSECWPASQLHRSLRLVPPVSRRPRQGSLRCRLRVRHVAFPVLAWLRCQIATPIGSSSKVSMPVCTAGSPVTILEASCAESASMKSTVPGTSPTLNT